MDLNYECVCNTFGNRFWTHRDEMLQDIKDEGYEVIEDFGEFIEIDEGNGIHWLLYISMANTTMWVSYIREANY